MGRPRKWSSDAERKAAERGSDPWPDNDGIDGEPDLAPVVALPIRRTPAIGRDEYVAAELEVTRRLLDRGASNEAVDGKDRMDRSREYAEWRYGAYCNGEIRSL